MKLYEIINYSMHFCNYYFIILCCFFSDKKKTPFFLTLINVLVNKLEVENEIVFNVLPNLSIILLPYILKEVMFNILSAILQHVNKKHSGWSKQT